jgi:hypothetical protein
MTAPIEPTPGAPAAVPAPPTPAPTVTPPAPQQPTATFDPSSLTPEAQAYLKAQIDAADLKARTGSKANAAAEAQREMAAKVAKALGLAGAEPPDPAQLLEQAEAARDAAWASALELQIFRIAGAAGANPDALLDSRSFIDSLDELYELDPKSAEFKAALQAKVQAAAAKYPATPGSPAPGAPAGPRPDPTQGTRGTPTTARPTSLTQAYANHYAAKTAGGR